jgi:uroporphyrinogen-III synthase
LRAELAIDADLVTEVSTTQGLAAAIGAPSTVGASAVLTRADLATVELHDRLVEAGWTVTEVTAYRTVTRTLAPPVAEALADGRVDLVPVLSSSMAEALLASGRDLGVRAGIVSIGPVTSATLRAHGVEPLAEAATHDLDGLVVCVADCGRQLHER